MSHTRQLAAIMFTDIAGYTALMGEDEQYAFELLDKNRNLQRPIIEHYGGRWIKELGDGVMATFPTVTDAVLSAGTIQHACTTISGLKLRIGIHLGEVILENNDVFGDGVNIASRIQAIAPIGGIWISESVQKNISNKKGIKSKFVSAEKLKNVREPVRIYEVDVDSIQTKPVAAPEPKAKEYHDKSIAVLPFINMSDDPEQEYFSEGIAEEVLNSLTHVKELKVVCRTSSFQFKGRKIDLKEVGDTLRVAKVVEGSVRKQGNRIRVTAQLISVNGGQQLWSERYDRDMDDIFAVQDEIALAITERLKVTILEEEKQLINKTPTENTVAYELYLKGRYYWSKRGRWLVNALQHFQEAIQADPNFARAYAGIADAYSALGLYGIIPPNEAMSKAKDAAQKSIDLDPSVSEAYTSMGFINGIYENDRYLANKNFNHALKLNPGYAPGHSWYSFYLSIVENDSAKAEKEGLLSTKLEPYLAVSYHITGLAFLAQRKFDEALGQAFKSIEIDATLFLPYFLAGWCYIELGDNKKAVEYLDTALKLSGRHSWALGFMTLAQANEGNLEEARSLLNEIIERDKATYFSTFGSAIGAAALNEIDLALEFLEKGYRNKDILLPIFGHLTVMPPNLRNDSRFLSFLRRIKLID